MRRRCSSHSICTGASWMRGGRMRSDASACRPHASISLCPRGNSAEVWFLHPMQGPLVLMQAAVMPVPTAEVVLAVASAACWLVLAAWLAHRAFRRFVVQKEGVR